MSITGNLAERASTGTGLLSRREILTLNHAANGLADKQIARAMNVEVSTIRTHWKRARGKLHALNRTHAVCIAVTLGIAGVELVIPSVAPDVELGLASTVN
jgi:DNA-binding NarL/FixJ family response regulator